MTDLYVIGGGLAGSEAAWQAAQRGLTVRLYEMRPNVATGAHLTDKLGELVCSNSLGSNLPDRASGILKAELRTLSSLLLECAEATALPAGSALAVDREAFSGLITARLLGHPNIEIIREEMVEIPTALTIIASGPLTSPRLSERIRDLSGEEHLYFFDAIAPIIARDSVNMAIAFRGSRYDKGELEEGDYINCPLDRREYIAFAEELAAAERIELRDFERELESGVRAGLHHFFEGCLPVEIIAQRGLDSLAFGPMRPVGLTDPRSGRRPHAVVQLRQDNLAGDLYNMVGFQTNLKFPEQRRVLRMIPGLEGARFERYGQMHRNTFIASPKVLLPTLQHRARSDLFFAGQITGVEGYLGNIGTGLLAGWNAARLLQGETPLSLPPETMLGALCRYVTQADMSDFQPMKSNLGILPPLLLDTRNSKRERALAHAQRSSEALDDFLSVMGLQHDPIGQRPDSP
jgi:methylenetetrahydrofolate--tRNA-(uracil-5-)-methyltransferase